MRRAVAGGARVRVALAQRARARSPGQSEREHVPPDPPQTRVHAMPYHEMADMMGMDDRKRFGKVMLDRLEWRDGDSSIYEWDAAAWYGGDFNKLWIETEGEHARWRARTRAWKCCGIALPPRGGARGLGLRSDVGDGPSRSWAGVRCRGSRAGFRRARSHGLRGRWRAHGAASIYRVRPAADAAARAAARSSSSMPTVATIPSG